jgi:hypothetical protein
LKPSSKYKIIIPQKHFHRKIFWSFKCLPYLKRNHSFNLKLIRYIKNQWRVCELGPSRFMWCHPWKELIQRQSLVKDQKLVPGWQLNASGDTLSILSTECIVGINNSRGASWNSFSVTYYLWSDHCISYIVRCGSYLLI